jgi:hypothetical protein
MERRPADHLLVHSRFLPADGLVAPVLLRQSVGELSVCQHNVTAERGVGKKKKRGGGAWRERKKRDFGQQNVTGDGGVVEKKKRMQMERGGREESTSP